MTMGGNMKKISVIILVGFVIFLSGCTSKFNGTWCRYSDVPSSLIVLKKDYNDYKYKELINYINKIPNLRSFDVVDDIEDSSILITVYYNNEENISTYENEIRKYDIVDRTEFKKLNIVVDKLNIQGNNTYTFDMSLNSLSAREIKGKYSIQSDILKLDNENTFYYKNKFLCYDKDCNMLMTKSISSTCD